MQVGELAGRFDLNPKTICYDEEIGLLPPPHRTASSYRRYDEAALSTVAFIPRAKLLDLSLLDIRDILAACAHGEQPCARVLALVDAEIARIGRLLGQLTSVRGSSRRYGIAGPTPRSGTAHRPVSARSSRCRRRSTPGRLARRSSGARKPRPPASPSPRRRRAAGPHRESPSRNLACHP